MNYARKRRLRWGLWPAMAVSTIAAASFGQPSEVNRPRLTTQSGHVSWVYSVAFSPDGRQVLTGSMDKTARLWDYESRLELRSFEHDNWVFSAVFSPRGDQLLTGSADQTACLWNARTGAKIRCFRGHTGCVRSAVFSPDGRRLLTASFDNTARLWDLASGKEIGRFTGHTAAVHSAAFAPNGLRIVTAGWDQTVRVWDVETFRELHCFRGHAGRVYTAMFTMDGAKIASGGSDRTVRIWDVRSGQEVHRLDGHADVIYSVAVSPDGRHVASTGEDHSIRLWDLHNGKLVRLLDAPPEVFFSVAFSPDGSHLLAGSQRLTAHLFSAENGARLTGFVGRSEKIYAVAASANGEQLLTGGMDCTARLWDLRSGQQLRTFPGHAKAVHGVAFSPDGTRVLTGSWDGQSRLWETASARPLHVLRGHADQVYCVAFAPDGRHVATGSSDKTVRLWDTASGRELRRVSGHDGLVLSLAFSRDGRRLLTASFDKTARLWDVGSGAELRRYSGHEQEVSSAMFSADEKHVLTGSYDHTARVWDTASGQELRRFTGHNDRIHAARFAPDGRQVLTVSWDNTARLWDAQSGALRQRFEGHAGWVFAADFLADGRRLATGSADCSTRIWDTLSGQELCRLISFSDGAWAVIDPLGRYDASFGGDVEGLHWVSGLEPIALRQLKNHYYEPGLLGKILGFNKELPRKVAALAQPEFPPQVQIEGLEGGNLRLTVKVTNRGGGLGRVVVKINGKDLTADARNPGCDPHARSLNLELNLAADPRLAPGTKNVVEVEAFSAGGQIGSRAVSREFTLPGQAPQEPPELWAVVAGVSDYPGQTLDLRYAAKDATDFAQALKIAAHRLFGAQRVHLTVLTTDQEPQRRPTKSNVVRAVQDTLKSRRGDVLVVFLAGHGVNHGGPDGDFYYLTADAHATDPHDPELRQRTTLSSKELADLFRRANAERQILILDTCAAGRAVERLMEQRDVPSSQVRAMERLKDSTGLYILTGCAADAVSYEASRYAQGVLTHSLLLGMRGAALSPEQYVEVMPLFHFAANQVPELARGLGGIQRPVIASRRGASFPIGQVTPADQPRIPFQVARPLILRTQFQDEDAFTDVIGLGHRVDQQLRDASTRGREAPLVFIDAREFPDAYHLAGRYRIEGRQATITARLVHGVGPSTRFKLSGDPAKVDALAAQVVAEVQTRMGKLNPPETHQDSGSN